MNGQRRVWLVCAAVSLLGSLSFAQCGCGNGFNYTSALGWRCYWDYPYWHSIGPRYDPYWSYKSSYFPELYGGDGSYYGLGYSGWYGRGGTSDYGGWWYW